MGGRPLEATGPVLDAQAYADRVTELSGPVVPPFTYRAVASGLFNSIVEQTTNRTK